MTAPTPHPYCPHDEGEPCTCATELRQQVSDRERKQARKGAKSAADFAEAIAAVDELTAKGWAAREIAAWLGIGERTVYRARERGRAATPTPRPARPVRAASAASPLASG